MYKYRSVQKSQGIQSYNLLFLNTRRQPATLDPPESRRMTKRSHNSLLSAVRSTNAREIQNDKANLEHSARAFKSLFSMTRLWYMWLDRRPLAAILWAWFWANWFKVAFNFMGGASWYARYSLWAEERNIYTSNPQNLISTCIPYLSSILLTSARPWLCLVNRNFWVIFTWSVALNTESIIDLHKHLTYI